MLKMENVQELKDIIELNSQITPMEDMEFDGNVLDLEQKAASLLDHLRLLVLSEFKTKEMINDFVKTYDEFELMNQSFKEKGGFSNLAQQNNTTVEAGFFLKNPEQGSGKNAIYKIDNLVNTIKKLEESELSEGDKIHKINQKIEGLNIMTPPDNFEIERFNLNKNQFINQVNFYDGKINDFFKKNLLDRNNLDSKSMETIYIYGVNPIINGINDDAKLEESINSFNKINKEEKVNIDDTKISQSDKLILENGEVNPNALEIYSLMKSEKSTQWFKDNVKDLYNKDVLSSLNLTNINPAIDFAQGFLLDKEVDIEKPLETFFSSLEVKDNLKAEDLINYIKNHDENPIIFSALLSAFDKDDFNLKFSDSYNLKEEILSYLIGENSSCEKFNNNKISCLTSLISKGVLNPMENISIKTSNKLETLIQDQHNIRFNGVEDMGLSNQELILEKLIPKKLDFTNNKTNLISFINLAKDHLVLQNFESSSQTKLIDKSPEDTILLDKQRKTMSEIVGILNNNVNHYNLAKASKKIEDQIQSLQNWDGAISGILGSLGALLLLVVLIVVDTSKNIQEKNLLKNVNNILHEENLPELDDIKIKSENGEVFINGRVFPDKVSSEGLKPIEFAICRYSPEGNILTPNSDNSKSKTSYQHYNAGNAYYEKEVLNKLVSAIETVDKESPEGNKVNFDEAKELLNVFIEHPENFSAIKRATEYIALNPSLSSKFGNVMNTILNGPASKSEIEKAVDFRKSSKNLIPDM